MTMAARTTRWIATAFGITAAFCCGVAARRHRPGTDCQPTRIVGRRSARRSRQHGPHPPRASPGLRRKPPMGRGSRNLPAADGKLWRQGDRGFSAALYPPGRLLPFADCLAAGRRTGAVSQAGRSGRPAVVCRRTGPARPGAVGPRGRRHVLLEPGRRRPVGLGRHGPRAGRTEHRPQLLGTNHRAATRVDPQGRLRRRDRHRQDGPCPG